MQRWILLSFCSPRLAVSLTRPATQKPFIYIYIYISCSVIAPYLCSGLRVADNENVEQVVGYYEQDKTKRMITRVFAFDIQFFFSPLTLKTKEIDYELCNTWGNMNILTRLPFSSAITRCHGTCVMPTAIFK